MFTWIKKFGCYWMLILEYTAQWAVTNRRDYSPAGASDLCFKADRKNANLSFKSYSRLDAELLPHVYVINIHSCKWSSPLCSDWLTLYVFEQCGALVYLCR